MGLVSLGMTAFFFIKSLSIKGGCHGDSGGPAFTDREDKLELIGVISGPSTDAPCDEGHSTPTQVANYRGWLKCAFAAAGHPIAGLEDDDSFIDYQSLKN